MGSSSSKVDPNHPHLTAGELYNYSTRFKLTIAEVEYCFRRYNAFDHENGSFGDIKNVFKDTDWLLSRVLSLLLPQDNNQKFEFEEFLTTISKWQRSTKEEKLEFCFQLLDYDQNGCITGSDLTAFIQQMLQHEFKLGNLVKLRDKERHGILKYIGQTQFAEGIWCGIELETPSGKNDGSVNGETYFQCPPNCGVFVEFKNIELKEHFDIAKEIIRQLSPQNETEKSEISLQDFNQKLIEDTYLKVLLEINILPKILRG